MKFRKEYKIFLIALPLIIILLFVVLSNINRAFKPINTIIAWARLTNNPHSPTDVNLVCSFEGIKEENFISRVNIAYSWDTEQGRIYAIIMNSDDSNYLPSDAKFKDVPTREEAEALGFNVVGECPTLVSKGVETGIRTGPAWTSFYNAKGKRIVGCGGLLPNPNICEFLSGLKGKDAEVIIGTNHSVNWGF